MKVSFVQADASRLPLADKSVDLVFGSPPYCDARTYGIGAQRSAVAWVDWMLGVTAEALRVSRGPVLWVCAGVTRDRCYWPACEGLLWEGWRRGWSMECPCYWHRSGISGSGGDQWFRKDVEYVLCFKPAAQLPWSDNTAMGHAPKCPPGGAFSHFRPDGKRVHKTVVSGERGASGERQDYVPPDICNPGTLIKTTVGGGNLGHAIAHENEAPFPEALAEFFIRSFCPPGGITLDPFSGSGTTVCVAERLVRRGIGLDIRKSQCDLGTRRLTRPHAPVVKSQAVEKPMPLFSVDPGAAFARSEGGTR